MIAAALALSLAAAFEPRLAPGPYADSRVCYYRVLAANDDSASILYWFSWPDERHPVALVHYPYALWRLLYFGSREDIEFVRVEADLRRNKPVRLQFESPEVGRVVVGHRLRDLSWDFPAAGAHPVLAVASWNHLFEPAGAAEGAKEIPLIPMDDALYRRLRMRRRSLPR